MNLTSYLDALSRDLGGRFSEYDASHFVMIVPLGDGRYQTVLGNLYYNYDLQEKILRFNSKVCPAKEDLDTELLLQENSHLLYSKFSISEGFVKLEASIAINHINEQDNVILRKMVKEVAYRADVWEFKFTGLDIY